MAFRLLTRRTVKLCAKGSTVLRAGCDVLVVVAGRVGQAGVNARRSYATRGNVAAVGGGAGAAAEPGEGCGVEAGAGSAGYGEF